jgi:uncharacterized protein YbaR (Trm112 family)
MTLAPDFLRLLCCPACKGPLTEGQERLDCSACKLFYPVEKGIPLLIADAAKPV